ncbi:butyrophilin-like protein 10 isoform X2 [Sardina pilchardus]|uniref:butyrophilin-like protein 10 isoform X2 n=1 Tax=Sardina pilchardus TaxID=27697 RepID=UPI002E0D5DE9
MSGIQAFLLVMACVCSWLSKHWICVWVILHLCSTICDAGDFQLVGPDHPLYAVAGEDLVLPCSLSSMNAEGMTVEWLRLDNQGQSSIVHLYKDHKDINTNQMSSYSGRTSLFKEELKKGNTSLLIKQLSVADTGHYKCFVQSTDYDDISVQLSVISSHPVISLYDVNGGFSLVCELSGWNPEPAVDWLDGERRRLPADNQEWNSDGLTVKRRLVVDKLEKNSTFICRVSQNEKIKETIFHINEGWLNHVYPLQIRFHLIVGVTVVGVVVLVILISCSLSWCCCWRHRFKCCRCDLYLYHSP